MAHRPKISTRVRVAVYERDGYRCQYCGAEFPPADSRANAPEMEGVWLELDHIIPFVSGGASTVDNLRAACSPCNRRKSTYIRDEQWCERITRAIAVLQDRTPSRESAESAISELVGRKFVMNEVV